MNRPLVFISSTIQEMDAVRLRVKEFLTDELGYDVLMSEFEGSKPKTPASQCKQWAKECDIFIAILGKNYGWIVPKQGVSVSEMEFNEAYKDNPEKILSYLAYGSMEKRQSEFASRVQDFNLGYFRRKHFKNENELVDGLREDLAEFMKNRLDVIKRLRLQVKQRPSPLDLDYITSPLRDRVARMYNDTKQILTDLGFSQSIEFQKFNRLTGILLYNKRIKKTNVLFNIWVQADNLNLQYLRSFTLAHQQYVYYHDKYRINPDRFAIHIIHGKGTLRSLENHFNNFAATCFKVKPGYYCGAGFGSSKESKVNRHFENMLFLVNVDNKQSMVTKLSEAMKWLEQEQKKIDFRCNYKKEKK